MAGTVDQMLPDRGPDAARQALRAAREIRVFDGRATAWFVVQRLIELVGFAMILTALFIGSVLIGQWVWGGLGVGVLLFAYEGPVARRAGAEPLRWRARWRAAIVTGAIVLVLLSSTGALGSWAQTPSTSTQVAATAVLALCYLLPPVVRWLWWRRGPRGATRWPDGAQGYAVLSVLARAEWVHADRLAVLTGLPRGRCDEWVRACSARGLAVPAASRWVFHRNPEITVSGLARLDAWTAVLTERAAGAQPWTDSTAPTNPDVSTDRSASDVT